MVCNPRGFLVIMYLAVQTVYVRTFGSMHFMHAFLHSVVGLGVGSVLRSFPAMVYNLALHPSTCTK